MIGNEKSVVEQVIYLIDHPNEVLNFREMWWQESCVHIEEVCDASDGVGNGVSPMTVDYYFATRVLLAWCDQKQISGVECLWELYRQFNAIRHRNTSCWGIIQPREIVEDTMSKAIGAIQRIEDAATIMFNRSPAGRDIAKRVRNYVAKYQADGGDPLKLTREGIRNAIRLPGEKLSGSTVSATSTWQEIAEKKRQSKTPTIEAQAQKAMKTGDWETFQSIQRREEKQYRQYKS